jgi:hypothetical protein
MLAFPAVAYTAEPVGSGNAPAWCPKEVANNSFQQKPLVEVEEALRKMEGVKELRILTPDMAATLDYRVGRINVIHEDEIVIMTTCG